MAEQLAINSYRTTGQNRNVALVSFEMDEEEIYARLFANLTNTAFETIYLRKWSTGEDFQKYAAGLKEGKRGKIVDKCEREWGKFDRHGEVAGNRFTVWCPTMDVTPNQIGAILAPSGYDLVLVDYVGLVAAEKQADLWENLGEITKDFKNVARRNDCVVAVMAQMDEETNKVKYSKAMRHHSSYVWKWSYGEPEEETHMVEIEQDKARHCKRFTFSLRADFSTMAFRNPDDIVEEDVSSKTENAPPAIDKVDEEAEKKESTTDLIARSLDRRERSDFKSVEQQEKFEQFSTVTRSLSNLEDPTDAGDL